MHYMYMNAFGHVYPSRRTARYGAKYYADILRIRRPDYTVDLSILVTPIPNFRR